MHEILFLQGRSVVEVMQTADLPLEEVEEFRKQTLAPKALQSLLAESAVVRRRSLEGAQIDLERIK